jgi:hypothetical protein
MTKIIWITGKSRQKFSLRRLAVFCLHANNSMVDNFEINNLSYAKHIQGVVLPQEEQFK